MVTIANQQFTSSVDDSALNESKRGGFAASRRTPYSQTLDELLGVKQTRQDQQQETVNDETPARASLNGSNPPEATPLSAAIRRHIERPSTRHGSRSGSNTANTASSASSGSSANRSKNSSSEHSVASATSAADNQRSPNSETHSTSSRVNSSDPASSLNVWSRDEEDENEDENDTSNGGEEEGEEKGEDEEKNSGKSSQNSSPTEQKQSKTLSEEESFSKKLQELANRSLKARNNSSVNNNAMSTTNHINGSTYGTATNGTPSEQQRRSLTKMPSVIIEHNESSETASSASNRSNASAASSADASRKASIISGNSAASSAEEVTPRNERESPLETRINDIRQLEKWEINQNGTQNESHNTYNNEERINRRRREAKDDVELDSRRSSEKNESYSKRASQDSMNSTTQNRRRSRRSSQASSINSATNAFPNGELNESQEIENEAISRRKWNQSGSQLVLTDHFGDNNFSGAELNNEVQATPLSRSKTTIAFPVAPRRKLVADDAASRPSLVRTVSATKTLSKNGEIAVKDSPFVSRFSKSAVASGASKTPKTTATKTTLKIAGTPPRARRQTTVNLTAKPAISNARNNDNNLAVINRAQRGGDDDNDAPFRSTLSASGRAQLSGGGFELWLKQKSEIEAERRRKIEQQNAENERRKAEKKREAEKCFERWKMERDQALAAQSQKRENAKRARERNERAAKDEKRQNAERTFEHWKRSHMQELERRRTRSATVEQRRSASASKRKSEKDEEADRAYSAWLREKEEKQRAELEQRREAEAEEEERRKEEKQYKQQLSKEAYELWLQLKHEEHKYSKSLAYKILEFESEAKRRWPSTPWLPTGNTVARKFVGSGHRRKTLERPVHLRHSRSDSVRARSLH